MVLKRNYYLGERTCLSRQLVSIGAALSIGMVDSQTNGIMSVNLRGINLAWDHDKLHVK